MDDDDKLNNESLLGLGQRGGWLINESGLYSLILSSKLPTAKNGVDHVDEEDKGVTKCDPLGVAIRDSIGRVRYPEISETLKRTQEKGQGMIQLLTQEERRAVAEEIKRIYQRYKKYGVTEHQLIDIYNSGIDNGMNPRASLAGMRLALSLEYQEHESFSVEDVAAALGITAEEAERLIRRHEREMAGCSGVVRAAPAPWLLQ